MKYIQGIQLPEMRRLTGITGVLGGAPLPSEWVELANENYHGVWCTRDGELSVIYSYAKYPDNKYWIHLSMTRRSSMPAYDDLAYLKRVWLGPSARAVMVFPPEVEKVNIHPRCLHLFSCLVDDGLPDFTMGSGSL